MQIRQLDNADRVIPQASQYIRSKEIGNKKYYEETRELQKWQSEILPEY